MPSCTERSVYNNALLERDLGVSERADAIAAMEAAYESTDITRFAAWVHESDAGMCSALERRGYTVDEVTRAMGMTLDDIRLPPPDIEVGPADWSEHLRLAGLARGFLSGGHADAGRRACSQRRWRSACTPPRGSATSGGASSTSHRGAGKTEAGPQPFTRNRDRRRDARAPRPLRRSSRVRRNR